MEDLLAKMRADWDARARENARHYVSTAKLVWTDEEFFLSGQRAVEEDILTDMINICQGKDPRSMRVLEIGCGAGRVTRALAEVFGLVCAVDISDEMVNLARQALADRSNTQVAKNSGADLSMFPDDHFDFAYSVVVFQHIPSMEIILSYLREVRRVLRPKALFKFQVQGGQGLDPPGDDTWIGVSISEEEAKVLAAEAGLELRYTYGADTMYFWLWCFKP